jgi:hypothetical protein
MPETGQLFAIGRPRVGKIRRLLAFVHPRESKARAKILSFPPFSMFGTASAELLA